MTFAFFIDSYKTYSCTLRIVYIKGYTMTLLVQATLVLSRNQYTYYIMFTSLIRNVAHNNGLQFYDVKEASWGHLYSILGCLKNS